MKARSYLLSLLAAAMLGTPAAMAAGPAQQAPADLAPAPKPGQTPKERAEAVLEKGRAADPQVPGAPRADFDANGAGAGAGTARALDATDLSAWLDGRVPYSLKSGEIAGDRKSVG